MREGVEVGIGAEITEGIGEEGEEEENMMVGDEAEVVCQTRGMKEVEMKGGIEVDYHRGKKNGVIERVVLLEEGRKGTVLQTAVIECLHPMEQEERTLIMPLALRGSQHSPERRRVGEVTE